MANIDKKMGEFIEEVEKKYPDLDTELKKLNEAIKTFDDLVSKTETDRKGKCYYGGKFVAE